MTDRPNCSIQRLISIVERLRGPNGCPWDQAQTTLSLRPFLVEECHEFIEAIERSNTDDMRDELGDLLLQIVLHARVFEEEDLFSLNDAAESVCNKLVRRHPHVFLSHLEHKTTDLELQWETIKQTEKNTKGRAPGLFELYDSELPPLQAAHKLSKKAAQIGMDWADTKSVLMKVREEIDELEEAIDKSEADAITHELGDLMFSIVNLARHLSVDTEVCLRQNNLRFINRIRHMESALHSQGKTFSESKVTDLNQLWELAKNSEKI